MKRVFTNPEFWTNALRLTMMLAVIGLCVLSSAAHAQWSVVDTDLNAKAAEINNRLTTLNGTISTYTGPNALAIAAPYVATITDLDTSVAAGGGTYGSAASAAIFPTGVVSTPCSTGKAGITGASTTLGTASFRSCELTRQVMAAAYQHSLQYYNKFVAYNTTLRSLIATPINNLNMGQLAALQFQVQSYQALQQNETAIFNANMEMHRTALDVIKERHRQIEREQVKGKTDRAGTLIMRAVMLALPL